MFPAVIGLASGTILLLSREEIDNPALHAGFESYDDSMKVPLGLSRKQWIAFLKAATCGNPRTITPSFRLGTFGMTVRRLCDLGAMADPKVIHFEGRQVWDAHWLNPVSLKAFQNSPMEQYNLFVSSIKDYSQSPELKKSLGQTVEGREVTLSGALMVAHRAGLPGMVSWLQDPIIRERFSDNTTTFFQKANGIF